MIFVENANDVPDARTFFRHDERNLVHQYLSNKWFHRNVAKWARFDEKDRCRFDVEKKAFDALQKPGGSLTQVNWTESEIRELDQYELRSLKPKIFVLNVSREAYLRQVR